MSQIVEPTPEASVQNWLLGIKAVKSMEHFMDGFIEYYMQVPSFTDSITQQNCPIPLVIVSDFTSGSRPLAWKSSDMKIQSTLPILGYAGVVKKQTRVLCSMKTESPNHYLVKVTIKLMCEHPM